jgi:DNA-binding MarR family transcriptional regulator
MSGFACARRDGVLSERLGEEIVLYDQEADTAHCLAPALAAVWEHADGTRSDTQIAHATGLDERDVADALDQLREAGLLEQQEPATPAARRPSESCAPAPLPPPHR